MKHLKLYEDLNKLYPELTFIVNYNQFVEFMKANKEIEISFSHNGAIKHFLPSYSHLSVEKRQYTWDRFYGDGNYLMCIYMKGSDLMSLVSFRLDVNSLEYDEIFSGRDSILVGRGYNVSDIRRMIHSYEFYEQSLNLMLNLLVAGEIRRYADNYNVMSKLIKTLFYLFSTSLGDADEKLDMEKILLELADKQGVDIVRNMKAAKLLMRS